MLAHLRKSMCVCVQRGRGLLVCVRNLSSQDGTYQWYDVQPIPYGIARSVRVPFVRHNAVSEALASGQCDETQDSDHRAFDVGKCSKPHGHCEDDVRDDEQVSFGRVQECDDGE